MALLVVVAIMALFYFLHDENGTPRLEQSAERGREAIQGAKNVKNLFETRSIDVGESQ